MRGQGLGKSLWMVIKTKNCLLILPEMKFDFDFRWVERIEKKAPLHFHEAGPPYSNLFS